MKSLNFLLDLIPFKFAIYQKDDIVFSYNVTDHEAFLKINEAGWEDFNLNEINYIASKQAIYSALKFEHNDQHYSLFSRIEKEVVTNWDENTWDYFGNIIFYITKILINQPELTSRKSKIEIEEEDSTPFRSDLLLKDTYDDMYKLELNFLMELKNRNAESTVKIIQKIFELSHEIFDKTEIKSYLIGYVHHIARFCVIMGASASEVIHVTKILEIKIHSTKQSDLDTVMPLIAAEFFRIITSIPAQYDSIIVNRAIDYINKNIYNKISNDDVAQSQSLSVSYLSSHFKATTGMSLKSFIIKSRIEESKHLLVHTDLQLSEIAYRLNFSSQSHFTKIFKDETGYTPHKYRNLFFGPE